MQADSLLQRLQNAELEAATEVQRERDNTIMRMWGKFDTVEIAAYLHVDESVVANRLAKLRDARHRN